MVNTHIPWGVVLLIGFIPAVSEEFTSRAFAIPFLQRFLNRRWLAVVIPALVWGFAHANYPQQPFYVRGIELGLFGIVLGYVVLRWGLLPALVWHYTFDALLTAMVLLRSSNSYFVVSTAISVGIMLQPLVVAIALYVRHRFFVDPTSLLNSEDSPVMAPSGQPAHQGLSPEALLAEAVPEVRYRPLQAKRLLVSGGIAAALLSVFLVESEEPLHDFDIAVNADQAEQIARDYLAAHTMDATEYRMERKGMAEINRLYEQDVSPCLWRVRFFQPLQKEDYHVFVDVRDGSVYTVTHLLEEEAAGADLDKDDARVITEQHLRQFRLDPTSFELKEASSENLVQRRDHSFVFEARAGDRRNIDESLFRVVVAIAGDQPVSLHRYIKLPEEWLRQHRESGTLRTALGWIAPTLFIAASLHLFWILIGQIRRGSIKWRDPIAVSIVAAAVVLTGFLNNLTTFYADYDTQQPEGVYILTRCVLAVLGMLFSGIGVIGAIGVITSLYPDCLQRIRRERWRYLRDAVWVAGIAWLAGLAVNRVKLLAVDSYPEHFGFGGFPSPDGLDSLLPSWDGMVGALLLACAFPFRLGVIIFYALRVIKRPSLIVTAVLVLSACGAGASAQTGGEFAASLSMSLLSSGFMALVIIFLLRDNLIAYAFFALFKVSPENGYQMLTQSPPEYQLHGWILVSAVLVPTLGSWVWGLKKSRAGESK